MQICSDPLEEIHSVGSDQQWCVTLPAGYPTIFPYISNNVEYNDDDKTPNTSDCTSIIDSPLCANSQLIQRLQHKLDLYQTSTSHGTQQSHRYLTNIVKQHASNGDRQDQANRNPAFSQEIIDRKNTNKRILSTDSSTQSVQSLSTENENYSDDVDNKILSSHSNDRNDRASSMMSIPVLSISRTPHVSKQQVVANDQLRQSIHNLMTSTSHFSDDHTISATDTKSDSFLSSSHNQQRVDSILSSKQSTSTIQSPTSYTSTSTQSQYSTQTENASVKSNKAKDRIERKKDYLRELRNNKIRKRTTWFEKLTKKISNKHLQTTPFHDSSPDNISHMYINNRKRFDCLDHLHMKDAMAALEFNLTEEACQTLINKKNDSQQNRLLYLLKASSRCCRSCRTQRRLATIAQRSIDIAIKKLSKYLSLKDSSRE